MSDPSPPQPGPPTPLAVRLADLYTALALAADEAEILAAVAAAFTPYGVAELRLTYLHCDERGRPREAETVAHWPAQAAPHGPRRLPATQLPLAHLWLRAADEPHWIPDLDDDPRLDETTRRRLTDLRSLAAIPLRDVRHGAWQGALFLGWTAPHARSAEEQHVARILVQAVTAAVTARRTLQAHADAYAETHTLYNASAELNQATSIAGLLHVLATTAAAYGATRAWLLTVDEEPEGRPAWLTLQAAWPPDIGLPQSAPRFAAQGHPLVELWQRDGLVPAFFADITDDRRIDPATRGLGEAFGVRGAIALPLAWRARWTAVVLLGWPAAHAARPGEQRLYTAIARQAAVALDNRLLLAQAQRALEDHRRERFTLATLLDNLPVGVFVNDAATGQTILLNRAGVDLTANLATPGVFHAGTDIPLGPAEHATARAAHTRTTVSGEVDLLRADGTRISIDTISTPILGDRGQPVRIVSVFQDITARRVADHERARMHADLVRLQAAALAERSTPLIPVTDEILVMPIVGAVDRDRGYQILETLVGLGGRTRVRVAILDLTGVRDLDAPAAEAILGAARALRLRGAVPILSGFHPASAVALTDLGLDLREVRVCATLQSAIVQAEALTRRPVPGASSGGAAT